MKSCLMLPSVNLIINLLWQGWDKYKSNLMSESEVPQWALQVQEEEKKDDKPEVLGPRRAREKKIVYDDGMSDDAWAKLIDDGKDVEEAIEARKLKRLKRKRDKGEEEASEKRGKT